jgi:hypothetical protein
MIDGLKFINELIMPMSPHIPFFKRSTQVLACADTRYCSILLLNRMKSSAIEMFVVESLPCGSHCGGAHTTQLQVVNCIGTLPH